MKTQHIEQLTDDYAKHFNDLRDSVDALNYEIAELKKKHLADIRTKVAATKSAETILANAISSCDDCFDKPKTLIFHGIKVGIQKKKGTIKFADNSLELINKKLHQHKHSLIITKESISKTYAAKLSVADIKKIGGEVIADRDEVVIKSVDSNVDKLVNQLLVSDEVNL